MGIRKSSNIEYKYHYTYKTTNLVNGKMYIGVHSTNDLRDGYKGSGSFLFKAIKKYGSKNFQVDILKFHKTQDEAYLEELSLVNEDWVKRKDTYNITIGGGKPPVQNRHGKDHPLYKIPHTAEHRLKNSIANKGRGAGANNPAYKGRIYAIFNGVKIAEFESAVIAAKELNISRGGIGSVMNKRGRTRAGFEWIRLNEPVKEDRPFKFLGYVYQLDINTHDIVGVFASCEEAMSKTGVLSSQIGNCCNYKNKTAGGFCWTRNLEEFKQRYNQYLIEREAARENSIRKAADNKGLYIVKKYNPVTHELLEIFQSIGAAALSVSANCGGLRYTCNKNRSKYKGFEWTFEKKVA